MPVPVCGSRRLESEQELGLKLGILMWDSGIPRSILTTEPHACPFGNNYYEPRFFSPAPETGDLDLEPLASVLLLTCCMVFTKDI